MTRIGETSKRNIFSSRDSRCTPAQYARETTSCDDNVMHVQAPDQDIHFPPVMHPQNIYLCMGIIRPVSHNHTSKASQFIMGGLWPSVALIMKVKQRKSVFRVIMQWYGEVTMLHQARSSKPHIQGLTIHCECLSTINFIDNECQIHKTHL